MMRALVLATLLAMPLAARADETGRMQLGDLTLDARGKGSAVLVSEDGNDYYCKAEETGHRIEISDCKQLVLLPGALDRAKAAPVAAAPGRGPAEEALIMLFEGRNCRLGYDALKSAIGNLDDDQRDAVSAALEKMMKAGEIIDDQARQQARLAAGRRCGA